MPVTTDLIGHRISIWAYKVGGGQDRFAAGTVRIATERYGCPVLWIEVRADDVDLWSKGSSPPVIGRVYQWPIEGSFFIEVLK